ncbi:XF1762 family protein [Solibacillus sp. FSL K6-1554]|uniref:XF1762 family protein n=1 Tax=Solibacillus sp. FSL K6-1554 TaxID=2921472 RepID=UPI0030FAC1CA
MSKIQIPQNMVSIVKNHVQQVKHFSDYHFKITNEDKNTVDVMNVFELIKSLANEYGIHIQIQHSNENEILFIVRDWQMVKQLQLILENSSTSFSWIFYNEESNTYLELKDYEVTEESRWFIEDAGFVLLADSVTGSAKDYMKLFVPTAKPAKFETTPVSLKEAQLFVEAYHRHHKKPQGHRVSIGVALNGHLIGVIIGGRPVSRHMDDRKTFEITRCCVKEGFKNAVSYLYGEICRAAKSLGYKRAITYTLISESGTSMRAVGFKNDFVSPGGSWKSKNRERTDKHPTIPKYRWVRSLQ